MRAFCLPERRRSVDAEQSRSLAEIGGAAIGRPRLLGGPSRRTHGVGGPRGLRRGFYIGRWQGSARCRRDLLPTEAGGAA